MEFSSILGAIDWNLSIGEEPQMKKFERQERAAEEPAALENSQLIGEEQVQEIEEAAVVHLGEELRRITEYVEQARIADERVQDNLLEVLTDMAMEQENLERRIRIRHEKTWTNGQVARFVVSSVTLVALLFGTLFFAAVVTLAR